MSDKEQSPGARAVIQALKTHFRGFAPTSLPSGEDVTGGFPKELTKRFKVERQDIPIPTLALCALALIGCRNLGSADKTAWQMPFVVDGTPCKLALEKFGLRLYVAVLDQPRTATDPEAVRQRVVTKLRGSAKILERLFLKPLSEQQVRVGAVTIANQYLPLRQAFEYFREGAKLAFAGQGRFARNSPPSQQEAIGVEPGFASDLTRAIQEVATAADNQREGFYNLVATLNAYMSLLEHTLVITLPFVGFDSEAEDLVGFIGKNWGDKFKRVFDIGRDRMAKKHFDDLHEVNETWRNTYSHGGFGKKRATIYFHMPGVGAIPAALSDVRASPHFDFIPADEDDFSRVMEVVDGVDAWLRNGPAAFGMRWAQSGLDVRYDSEFRRDAASAMGSAKDFEEMLRYHEYQTERHDNMEY